MSPTCHSWREEQIAQQWTSQAMPCPQEIIIYLRDRQQKSQCVTKRITACHRALKKLIGQDNKTEGNTGKTFQGGQRRCRWRGDMANPRSSPSGPFFALSCSLPLPISLALFFHSFIHLTNMSRDPTIHQALGLRQTQPSFVSSPSI